MYLFSKLKMGKELFTVNPVNPVNQQSINQLLLDGKFEEAQNLLKKTMSSEKEEKAKDTAEVLWWPRSWEARKLAEQSNWKIVLRPDGKIDFPELGIKGMGRLSVEWPTDQENWLVQGDHVDQYNNKWVSWISYMTWERAMNEVTKQGKKLLPVNSAGEKTNALLATLWGNWAEQSKALQALFWADFSGCWDPNDKRWLNVGSVSYLGLSEVDTDGDVRTVNFNSSNADQYWFNQLCPQVFLACEDC